MNKTEWDAVEKGWQRDMDVHRALFGPELLTEQFIIEEMPHYTTDRNACALVLDEIERRGLECETTFYQEMYKMRIVSQQSTRSKMSYGGEKAFLRADPDTICYAAVKAVLAENRPRSD